jgi:gamma-carbonic anhydrase
MPVYPYRQVHPKLGADCFVAPGAHVIGDVELGDQVSVWFGTTIRGDVFHIRIGDRSNVQDNSVIHVTTDRHPTIIGCDVTIGHRAILHGCTIEDGALIGMGAIVMDRAVIGKNALVAAGSLVTEGTIIPANTLAVGSPAKPRRTLSEKELAHLKWSAEHYAEIAQDYVETMGKGF